MHQIRVQKLKSLNCSKFARHASKNNRPEGIETKNFASNFEIKSSMDLEKFRNMSFEELDEWCDNNTKKPKTVPFEKRRKVYFRDTVKVHTRGGHGGSGIATFERVPHKRVGPPNGGDGGIGGEVIIKAISSEPNLGHIKGNYVAGSGGSGMSNKKTGKKGSPVVITVPVGTTVTEISPNAADREFSESLPDDLIDFEFIPYDKAASEENKKPGITNNDENLFAKKAEQRKKEDRVRDERAKISDDTPGIEVAKKVIDPVTRLQSVDLMNVGEYFVASRGGRAGKGNTHFASGKDRSPQKTTSGKEGEKRWFIFELKMIAQVGLVGFPNAGKSSLLAAISNATPKIANYPFTTMSPSIGTLEFQDSFSISVADLPGIIEDAHKNRGLGIEFLKHIERTHVICFVLDMSGSEGDPKEDFAILRKELILYKPELVERTALIVCNKMDLPKSKKNYESFLESIKDDEIMKDIPVFPISAKNKENVEPLKEKLRSVIEPNVKRAPHEDDSSVIDVSSKFQKIWDKIEQE